MAPPDSIGQVQRGGTAPEPSLTTLRAVFDVDTDRDGVVVISGVLPCSAETAYEAFTRPEVLTRWWPTEAAADPSPGGSYEFAWPEPDWRLTGTYQEVDPGRRLSFTWSWDHDDIDTTVTIEFLPAADGTEIRIAHAYVFADEREGYVEGWLHFLGRLREIL